MDVHSYNLFNIFENQLKNNSQKWMAQTFPIPAKTIANSSRISLCAPRRDAQGEILLESQLHRAAP